METAKGIQKSATVIISLTPVILLLSIPIVKKKKKKNVPMRPPKMGMFLKANWGSASPPNNLHTKTAGVSTSPISANYFLCHHLNFGFHA